MSQYRIKGKDKKRMITLLINNKGYSMSLHQAKQIIEIVKKESHDDNLLIALEKGNTVVMVKLTYVISDALLQAVKEYEELGYKCYFKIK